MSEEPADWAEDWAEAAEASVPAGPVPSSRAPEPIESMEAMGSEANQATSSNLGLGRPIESGGLEAREGPLEFGALSFEALSPGSVGHPVLCKRPCVHVLKGNPCPEPLLR